MATVFDDIHAEQATPVTAGSSNVFDQIHGEQNQESSQDLRGFWDSAKEQLMSIPHAFQSWWNGGAGPNASIGSALDVVHKIDQEASNDPANKGKPRAQWKYREPTQQEQSILDHGSEHALRAATSADGNLLTESVAPGMVAVHQAANGNVKGAAGTILGAAAIPAITAGLARLGPEGISSVAKGAYEEAKTPATLPIKLKGLPPIETAGPKIAATTATGALVGSHFGGMPGAIAGGVVGAAVPLLKGAYAGAKKAFLNDAIKNAPPRPWLAANVEPEPYEPPPAIESIPGELPSGRTVGPAPAKAPVPIPERPWLASDIPPSEITPPPRVEAIPNELPSGRKVGPASPGPPPATPAGVGRVPIWANADAVESPAAQPSTNINNEVSTESPVPASKPESTSPSPSPSPSPTEPPEPASIKFLSTEALANYTKTYAKQLGITEDEATNQLNTKGYRAMSSNSLHADLMGEARKKGLVEGSGDKANKSKLYDEAAKVLGRNIKSLTDLKPEERMTLYQHLSSK